MAESKLSELQRTCDKYEERVKLLTKKIKLLEDKLAIAQTQERLAFAKEIYSSLGFQGSALATQLNLIYYNATGEDLLDQDILISHRLMTAEQLGEKYNLSAREVNSLLASFNYQYNKHGHWYITNTGLMAGGRMMPTGMVSPTGKVYKVPMWPITILGECEAVIF